MERKPDRSLQSVAPVLQEIADAASKGDIKRIRRINSRLKTRLKELENLDGELPSIAPLAQDISNALGSIEQALGTVRVLGTFGDRPQQINSLVTPKGRITTRKREK